MHQFDQDILFELQKPFHFSVNISDRWSINNNPHGGYLMALMANAAVSCCDKKLISIFTANFINRCRPGAAEIIVEKTGHSRSFDRLQVKLLQDGEEKIRALGTFMAEGNTGEHIHEQEAPEIQPLDRCIQMPVLPTYTFYNNIDLRLEPESSGWWQNNLSDCPEIRGWVRFKDSRPFDQISLAMLADSFPPPVLAKHGMVAWVPTIEFSFNLRNLSGSDWLKCVFYSRFIDNGIVDEDGEIWDETGKLIAISRQISQFRKQ